MREGVGDGVPDIDAVSVGEGEGVTWGVPLCVAVGVDVGVAVEIEVELADNVLDAEAEVDCVADTEPEADDVVV